MRRLLPILAFLLLCCGCYRQHDTIQGDLGVHYAGESCTLADVSIAPGASCVFEKCHVKVVNPLRLPAGASILFMACDVTVAAPIACEPGSVLHFSNSSVVLRDTVASSGSLVFTDCEIVIAGPASERPKEDAALAMGKEGRLDVKNCRLDARKARNTAISSDGAEVCLTSVASEANVPLIDCRNSRLTMTGCSITGTVTDGNIVSIKGGELQLVEVMFENCSVCPSKPFQTTLPSGLRHYSTDPKYLLVADKGVTRVGMVGCTVENCTTAYFDLPLISLVSRDVAVSDCVFRRNTSFPYFLTESNGTGHASLRNCSFVNTSGNFVFSCVGDIAEIVGNRVADCSRPLCGMLIKAAEVTFTANSFRDVSCVSIVVLQSPRAFFTGNVFEECRSAGSSETFCAFDGEGGFSFTGNRFVSCSGYSLLQIGPDAQSVDVSLANTFDRCEFGQILTKRK
ncbi:MAG: right-handed parallel beta-helix repeat-containing protein [Candidatus Brocadiia bacterium]